MSLQSYEKLHLKNVRPRWIWILLLVAILLAFLIWWHFDIQIEKLNEGG